jgi:hypothetical protein
MPGRKRKDIEVKDVTTIRASVSFSPEVYRTLEEIADKKKVSLAWVVREAAEEYISGKWPLFNTAPARKRQS